MGQPRPVEAAEPVPAPRLVAGVVAALRRGQRAGRPGRVPRGRLVGALPMCVRRKYGLRVLSFVGGEDSSLADVLVEDDERGEIESALVERGTSAATTSRSSPGSPPEPLRGGARPFAPEPRRALEAPVLDLTPGWQEVYTSKLSSKKRNHYRRRRRRLAEAGRLEVDIARTADELERRSTTPSRCTTSAGTGGPTAPASRRRSAGASTTRRSGRWRRSASRGSSR